MRLLASRLCIDRGGRRILSDVSFELRSGLLIVTGPNGTGKSSLLRVLAGLLPPSDGSFAIDETDEDEGLPHYLGHRDGLKPQLTARENLAFAAGFLAGSAAGLDPVAALSMVGLDVAADVPAAWLSAGQKRRVALARLLVAPRRLWLLDEPTTGLDSASVTRFEAMAAHHVAGGGLIVAATHLPLGLAAQELRLGLAPASA